MKRMTVWSLLLCLLLAALANGTAFAAAPVLERSAVVELGAPAAPEEFVLLFTEGGATSVRESVEKLGGQVLRQNDALRMMLTRFEGVTTEKPETVEALLVALKRNPAVVTAEVNARLELYAPATDPLYPQQWGLPRINAPAMWDSNMGSSNTKIAIVDSGVRSTHQDLKAKLVPGASFGSATSEDADGHGTHVAGIAAAATNNGLGGAGTCPNCRIMPVRVMDDFGNLDESDIADGIQWAADNGAAVINLSLGGPTNYAVIRNAVEYAWDKGVFLACAAGNDATSNLRYPAAYEDCMAVANTTDTDELYVGAHGSNYGPWVEVAAPGTDILSTYNHSNTGYAWATGTSMAAPFVAGYAGLLSGKCWNNEEIWDTIMLQAEDIAGTGPLWSGGRLRMEDLIDKCNLGHIRLPDLIKWPDFYWKECMCLFDPANWVQRSRLGYELITKEFTRGSEYAAWLGGYNYADDRVSQRISIPEGGTLLYSWYQSSREESRTPTDVLKVRLLDAATGRELATLKTHSNAGARDEWMQESIDLSAFAGQHVTLEFSVTTDSILTTSFVIDQVSVK